MEKYPVQSPLPKLAGTYRQRALLLWSDIAPSSCYHGELQVWVPRSGLTHTLTPEGGVGNDHFWKIRKKEKAMPSLRKIGFVSAASALRALRHKGRGGGVDGKEASMACSFLLASLICSPEESRGSEATVHAIREQSQRP